MCSNQFAQIYTIHVFGSNDEETTVVPVLFAFLPNKMKNTYLRLFPIFLRNVTQKKLRAVSTDIVASAFSAITEVFPTLISTVATST